MCEPVRGLSQSEIQQKAEVAPEDSDLDRKRRETEALLQSIGISPEPPLGNYTLYINESNKLIFICMYIIFVNGLYSCSTT